MKMFACELCGSNEISKKDGMFECAHCGTKYTAEDAKKLFITVDNTQKISNSLEAARKARDMSNWASAAKHYDEVLGEDPDNWEAIFFSSYCVNHACKIAEIASAAVRMTQTVELTLKQIKASVPEEEQVGAVTTVITYTIEIGNLLYNSAVSHYNGIDASIQSKYTGELNQRTSSATNLLITCAKVIHELFAGTEIAPLMLFPAKAAVNKLDGNRNAQDALLGIIETYDAKYVEEFKEARKIKDAKATSGCMFGLGIPLLIAGITIAAIVDVDLPVLGFILAALGILFIYSGIASRPKKKKDEEK